jgi:hypothetical protein
MRTNGVFHNQEHKRGAALMTLMIIMLMVAGTGAYLVKDAKQQTFAVTHVRDYLKAQAYAEGGANQAYSLLKTNFALRTNPSAFPQVTYGDGTYDVTVTPVGTNKAFISCIGQRGAATVNVLVDIQNFAAGTGGPGSTSGVPPAVGAYTYAILSGGSQGWSGSGTLNVGTGKIHSNGQLKMTGSKQVTGNISSSVKIWLTGSTKINGNATAPVITADAGAITGTRTVAAVPIVTVPDFDATAYKAAAQAVGAGAYYAGDVTFTASAGDIVPPGGIMYSEGDITIHTSGRMIGSFIANGEITITGSGDQIKVGNYPAFVSLTGKNDQSGSGKIHGLIYAGKSGTLSFDRSGSGDVTGTIMSKGNFDASGSWSALAYENSTPVAPVSGGGSGSGSSGDRVGVIAWQK